MNNKKIKNKSDIEDNLLLDESLSEFLELEQKLDETTEKDDLRRRAVSFDIPINSIQIKTKVLQKPIKKLANESVSTVKSKPRTNNNIRRARSFAINENHPLRSHRTSSPKNEPQKTPPIKRNQRNNYKFDSRLYTDDSDNENEKLKELKTRYDSLQEQLAQAQNTIDVLRFNNSLNGFTNEFKQRSNSNITNSTLSGTSFDKNECDNRYNETTYVSSSSQTDFDQAFVVDSEDTIEEDEQQKDKLNDSDNPNEEATVRYRSSIVIENRPRAYSMINYNYKLSSKQNDELDFKRLRFSVNSNGESVAKPILKTQNLNENSSPIKMETSRLSKNNETLYRFITKIRFS